MFISDRTKFIVNVAYVNSEKLGFKSIEVESRDTVVITEAMKKNIENKIQYLFFKVKDLSSYAPEGQVYTVYESLFKGIIMAHVNNVPCMEVIKTKPINGMNAQQLMDMHLAKFKEVYNFHVNAFQCNEASGRRYRTLDESQLQLKLQDLNNEVELMLKQMYQTASKLTVEQVLSMHLLMMETFMDLLINNIPCFEKAKNGFNGMTLEQIQQMHKNQFTETFNMHVNLLNCK